MEGAWYQHLPRRQLADEKDAGQYEEEYSIQYERTKAGLREKISSGPFRPDWEVSVQEGGSCAWQSLVRYVHL